MQNWIASLSADFRTLSARDAGEALYRSDGL
jgi:hypothetical protein